MGLYQIVYVLCQAERHHKKSIVWVCVFMCGFVGGSGKKAPVADDDI